VLPIFELLRGIGDIPDDDYRRTFNLGIGMIFIIGKRDAAEARKLLDRMKEQHYVIGEVVEAKPPAPRVVYA
jgi:phosphoribosylformylglycinamidine cyclo-ligase